jgi:hypothetical protein
VGLSCGDLVLVSESAEDLFPADRLLDEVDRCGWLGVGLSRGELAMGPVRATGVVVQQVLGQYPFALGREGGACGGLARIPTPAAVNTASKEPVNWPARSLIRNLTEAVRWPRPIRKLRAACVVHVPSGFAVMPAR